MKTTSILIATLTTVAVTIVTGIVNGSIGGRWTQDDDFTEAVARLQDFPTEFGSWRLQEEQDLEPSVVRMLKCKGYINRIYVNRNTGESVTVAVLFGPCGPIAVHTPEICYSSRDFNMLGTRSRQTIHGEQSPDASVWSVDFESQNVARTRLNICYAWTPDGHWEAPDNARFAFMTDRWLYKLQLATLTTSGSNADPCSSFLEAFLPTFNRHQFVHADE